MSICNCNNNTVIGRSQCPADRIVNPVGDNPMAPTEISFEVEMPTNFISGLDGKSAYEYAKEGGYEGTEEEFYADLGKIKEYEGRVDGIDERLTEIEEHGFAGKYLSEVETFDGLSLADGTRVMYIGPTDENYTNGYIYAYSSSEKAWQRVDVQPMPEVPEIPDLEEIRTAVSTFNSFYGDKDYVDSTINKWEELRDFLDGMSDQDSLSGKLTNMREFLEQQISDKQDEIIGAATTITNVNLSANKALVSNAQGKVAVSTVSAAELGYLSGTTGAIQTQIDGKQDELTFDSAPTLGSSNPVTSNGIRLAIDAASALNRLRFATAASVNYNLATVDTSTYAVNDMLTITDLGSNSLKYMASGVQRTFTGPFDFDLMFRWTGSEFRPMFPFMNWAEYN